MVFLRHVGALQGPSTHLVRCFPELQRNMGHRQVCGSRRSGPRKQSTTTDANLDCAFVENALVFIVPKVGRARGPLGAPLFTKFNIVSER